MEVKDSVYTCEYGLTWDKEGFVQIDWLYGSIQLLGILPLDQKIIKVNKEASSDLTGIGGL